MTGGFTAIPKGGIKERLLVMRAGRGGGAEQELGGGIVLYLWMAVHGSLGMSSVI